MKPGNRNRFLLALASLVIANAAAYALIRAAAAVFHDSALPPATRTVSLLMVMSFAVVTCGAAFLAIDFSKRLTASSFGDRLALLAASAAIFGTALAFPPIASADNAWNLLMGRAWAIHGANPYLMPASAFSADPAFAAVSPAWHGWSAVYGPLWTMLSAVPAYLADSPEAQRLALRMLCVLGYVFAGLVIRSALRRQRDAASESVFAFWMLNPLAAFEIANAGHNEGVLLPFLALAAAGLAVGRLQSSAAGIIGAALVKIWPIILLPTLVGIKTTASRALAVAVACAAVFIATWSVFWSGPATLTALARHGASAASPYFYAPFRFFAWASASLLGLPDPAGIGHGVALATFLAAIAFITVRVAKGRLSPLHASLAIMAAYHFVWLNWLQPWHLLAFLPFVPFAFKAERAIAGMALVGMTGLAFYFVPPWFIALAFIIAYAIRTSATRKKKRSA
jgi:hypothetical protein